MRRHGGARRRAYYPFGPPSASKQTHTGHEAEQRCGCFTGMEGQLQPEYKRVSPPRLPWTVGKAQSDGLNDYEALLDVQDRYVITPLSHWRKIAERHAGDPFEGVAASF